MSTVNANFRGFVRPGDLLELRAELLSRHDDSAKVKVLTTCEGKRVCEAEILYIFVRLDHPALEAQRNDVLDVLTRTTRMVE